VKGLASCSGNTRGCARAPLCVRAQRGVGGGEHCLPRAAVIGIGHSCACVTGKERWREEGEKEGREGDVPLAAGMRLRSMSLKGSKEQRRVLACACVREGEVR
jgi:hypothetical protein